MSYSKRPPPRSSRESSWQTHCQRSGGPLLVLDRIQDMQNAGSMARSAEALGVKALLLCGKGARLNDAFHRISMGGADHLPCFQVSNTAGCLRALRQFGFWICGSAPMAPLGRPVQTAEEPSLPGNPLPGSPLAASNRAASKPVASNPATGSPVAKGRAGNGAPGGRGPLPLKHFESQRLPEKERLALLIGNEHSGLPKAILQQCDFIVAIPLLGKTQSLNASVATGILLDRIVHR